MIHFFARHPTAANLLMVMFMVLGLFALPDIKRETFPEFAADKIQVSVPYPGASAADVENGVCLLIEEAVESINDVEKISCTGQENSGIAEITMAESGDITRFLDDIKSEIDAINNFPDEAEDPVVTELGRTDAVVSIAVTGPMSVTSLKAYAEELKDRLQLLPQVSQVTIQGFSDHQLRVEVSALALQRFGLSMNNIADAISRQSVDLPAGGLETREQDLLVRFTDQRRTARELESLIVLGANASGGEVRLGDLATITDRFEQDEAKSVLDGKRAAILQVKKTKAQDTLKVVDEVQAFLTTERQVMPPGVKLVITQDMASIVRDRLSLLLKNGAQGLVLVFLAMWLFFRMRFAFWVTMGLPVSFLGGLYFLAMLGYSINMITMVGLLIALGLLMDDAIVISENIASKLKNGKSALDSAVEGTLQVFPGVLSSFLTTVCIFGPLAFISGDIGKVLKVMPVVLILVLAVSLVEAFWILPHHLAHALQDHVNDPPGPFRRRFEAGFEWVRHKVLGGLIDTVIHWRYLFVGLVLAVFMVSIGMLVGGHVKFQAFPDIEGDTIQARVLLPQGTPLWRTEAVVDQITTALAEVDQTYSTEQPDGLELVKHVSVSYNTNADAGESGPHVATVTADLLTAQSRTGTLDAIISDWRSKTGTVPDVISLNFKEPTVGPGGIPIEIRLTGTDLDELKAASHDMQEWLGRYRGVFDLSDNLRPGKPEVRLTLRQGTLALGLDAATIASQLRAAYFGITADEVQVGSESYDIDVILAAADQASLEDLAQFRIVTPGGDLVPLSSVAEMRSERGFAQINRINGRRAVTVQGDIDTRYANASEVVRDTRAEFLPELVQRHPGVTVNVEGQSAESADTSSSMMRGFATGLIGIFILLSFQFRSYVEPLVVMMSIPMALIGVIWGHVLMGLSLSMPSMMGAASLAGIVVNDSILLVVFLKMRTREGHEVPEAAKMASRERFRAVFLTSFTTVAGLVPLLSETSTQAQVLVPLVTSIVFGLLASTVLVLLLVPAMFSILADWGLTSVKNERELVADN